MPSSPIRIPPKTPAAATIEPTERSIPAVAITKVMPIASTPTTLAWVSMFRMLSQVAKVSGLRIAPTTNRRTTTIRERVLLELQRLHVDPLATRGRVHSTSSASTGASVGATAWRSSSRSVASFPSTSATISPSRMIRMRVQMPDQLLELGRDHEDAQPGAGEVADDPVDLGLRRHVHAAGRLVEQQDPALVQQPAREHDLLLVAAREQADGAVGIVRDGAQAAELLVRPGALGLDVQHQPREPAEVGERHVLRLAPVEHQGLGLAVLRGEPEPPADRAARTVRGSAALPRRDTSPLSGGSSP